MDTDLTTQYQEIDKGLTAQALGLAITTADQRDFAAGMLRDLRHRIKEGDKLFKPVIESAHKAHKDAVALKKQVMAETSKAEEHVELQMSTWDTAQRKIREAAEEERLKRINETSEAAVDLVHEAQGRGSEAVADAVALGTTAVREAETQATPMPAAASEDDMGIRVGYKAVEPANDVEKLKFIAHVAAGHVSPDALTVSMSFLNASAKVHRKEGEMYPGVMVVRADTYNSKRGQ